MGGDGVVRICSADAWTGELSEPAPSATRWATREVRGSPQWTRWHYTEGNHLFTACGKSVQIFTADGSPQNGDLIEIDCIRCLSAMEELNP